MGDWSPWVLVSDPEHKTLLSKLGLRTDTDELLRGSGLALLP